MALRPHRPFAAVRVCALGALAVLLSFAHPADIGHAQSSLPPLTPWRGLMEHVSGGMAGWPTSGWVRTYWRAISADGRYAVMDSQSSELVPGDTNFQNDVFLRDRLAGTTTRVSVSDAGGESDGWSELASISANGRHVAFSSNATNLVPGMTEWHYQVYVRDLERSRTVHVSVAADGTAADADSGFAVLSGDGRFVAFLSGASTLVPGIAAFSPVQAYVFDRDSDGDGDFDEPGATSLTLVSHGPSGVPAASAVDQVRISSDGRFVLMQTIAALDPTAPENGALHAYLHDRTTGVTTIVDRSVTGGPSAWGVESRGADLSDDGRYVTYPSISHDIVPLDMNWTAQAFRYDRLTGETVIASRASDGTLGSGHSYNTSISSDGRYVAFSTAATNLVTPAPVAGADALVVRDMTVGTFTRIDVNGDGNGFDQPSVGAAISGDGSAVVLTTSATNAGISVYPSYLTNVFVATAFSVAPLAATFDMAGGSGSIEVNTTAVTTWKAESLDPSWITIMDGEAPGAGPRAVTYVVAPGSSRVGAIRVGQQLVSIRQFGDDTPPLVSPVITGTLGSNGWYVSNVHVSWTVSDPDSPITSTVGCVTTGFAVDTSGTNVNCQATSGGGTTTRSVTIRRDTTAPNITLVSPQPTLYDTGATVNASFFCTDGLSGMAGCAGTNPTATAVDTLTPGHHPFTVTATDQAGNTSTRSVEYAIGTNECTVSPSDLGGWWRMEGNTLNAVHYSTTPATRIGLTSDIYVDAVVGQGYSFQGTNGYLRLDYGGAISNDRKFAIAAWISPTSAIQGAIVSHKDQYRVARLSDGSVAWALKLANGAFNYVSTGVRVPLNVWSHVVVALDVDRVRTYLNGRLVHTHVNPGAFDLFSYSPATTSMVTIGATEDRGEFFKGGIDEVQLFAHGLNPSLIEPMYLAGAAGLCVPKATTFDVAQPITAKYGELTYPIVATLRDSDGQPVVGRSVYMESITGAAPYSTSSTMRVTDASGTVRWDAPLKNAPLGLQSESVFLDFAGDPHFVRFVTKRDVLVEIGAPVITWPAPQPLVYGAALSAAELNATANVPGTFTYTPAAGTVLDAGAHTLDVEFQPADTTRYTSGSATVGLEVLRRAPVLAVVGGTFTYDGQPHAAAASATGLGGTPLGPVEITYEGSAAAPADAGVYDVVATYAGDPNYEPATAAGTLTIERATATVTWLAPADLVYGTPLGASQLSATASVPGTFAYSPEAGTILPAGTHTLSVAFVPDDGANYIGASASTTVTVAPAMPRLTWSAPEDIVYGTPLSALQLQVGSSVPGTFAFEPAVGTVLGAGTHTLGVTFTPDDQANYIVATASVTLVVAKASPTLEWTTPASLTYGTPLGASQLNATASVPGTFEYSPAAGILLSAGTHALSVTFTPADTANYTPASTAVAIEVARATPALSWNTPAAVVYGTALNVAQLNATADVPGTFAYSPTPGTVLPAGTHSLSVTFTPDDGVNYTGAAGNAVFTVGPAPLTIRPHDAVKVYGAPLPPFSVATSDFVNGDTLASLEGTLVIATPATAGSGLGTYPLFASGLSSPNYAITYVPGVLTIVKASTTASVTASASPSGLNQPVSFTAVVSVAPPGAGMASGTVQFFDGGTLLGTAPLVEGVATLGTNGLAAGSHAIAALYSGDALFAPSSGGFTQTVNPASTSTTTVVTSSRHPSDEGQSVTFTAAVSSPSGGVSGWVEFYDGTTLIGTDGVSSGVARLITASLAPGGHAITARYLGNGTRPPSVSQPIAQHVELVGTRTRSSSTTVSATPSPSPLGAGVTLQATVSIKGNSTPGGRVLFIVNGDVLGDPAGVEVTATGSNAGAATIRTSALARGTHAITAVYLGDTACRASADSISLTVN